MLQRYATAVTSCGQMLASSAPLIRRKNIINYDNSGTEVLEVLLKLSSRMNCEFLLSIDHELDRRIAFLEDLNNRYQDTIDILELIINAPDEVPASAKSATGTEENEAVDPSSELLDDILAKAKEIRLKDEKSKKKNTTSKASTKSSGMDSATKKPARLSKASDAAPAIRAKPVSAPQPAPTVLDIFKRQIRIIESNPVPNFAPMLFPSPELCIAQYNFLSSMYQRPYFPPSPLNRYFTSLQPSTITWNYTLTSATMLALSSHLDQILDTYNRLWKLKLQRIHDSKMTLQAALAPEESIELFILWYEWRLCIDIYENMMYELHSSPEVPAVDTNTESEMFYSLIQSFPMHDPLNGISKPLTDEKQLRKWFKHQSAIIEQLSNAFSSRVEYAVEVHLGQTLLRNVVSELKACATLDPTTKQEVRLERWKNAWRQYQSCLSVLSYGAQDVGSCYFFLKDDTKS